MPDEITGRAGRKVRALTRAYSRYRKGKPLFDKQDVDSQPLSTPNFGERRPGETLTPKGKALAEAFKSHLDKKK